MVKPCFEHGKPWFVHGSENGVLMGTFYIFNIECPTKARNTYVFLEATFLENKKKAKKRVVIQKLLKELV